MSELKLVFWDVQHGSACYIKTPNGQHLVIDLGTGDHTANSTSFSPLLQLRDKYGVRALDGVIITHPHTDHIDDIFNFDTLSPSVLLRPKHIPDSDVRGQNQSKDTAKTEKYLEIHYRYTAGIASGASPFTATVNGCSYFQSWIPTSCATSNLNNQSVVTILSYAGTKLLVPGDNESPAWNELLDDASFASAVKGTNILLASHHGRENGYSSRLFEVMGNPAITIVSDGRFSDTSATSRYSARSSGWSVSSRKYGQAEQRKCLTTRSDGTIVVRCGFNPDGGAFREITRE